MRLSNSSLNTLSSCGQKFKYSYVDKLESIWKGSALPFGSAMDSALNHMLLNKDKEIEVLESSIAIFHNEWKQQKERNGSITQLQQNEFLTYSDSDCDLELLNNDDLADLIGQYDESWEAWFERLKTGKKMGRKFEDWKVPDRKFWNHVHWMSLNRKGPIMLKTYFEQILPEIHEVLEVQKHIELNGSSETTDGRESQDSIHGYVDFVIRMKDGTVVVMDNKTSSAEYSSDSASYSPQLNLYLIILNSMNLGYEVTHTGYAVLSKKIHKNKVKVCQSCGYEAEPGTSHKTCNNQIGGNRCGGQWTVTVHPTSDSQLIINKPPQKFQEDLLTNINNLNILINNGIYVKNFQNCNSYGRNCEYRELCYNGKMTKDLKKKE